MEGGWCQQLKPRLVGVCTSKGSQRHHLLSVHPHSPCPDQALWFLLPGQAALPRWPILHLMGAQGPALCPSWALGHLTSSLGLRPHLCADLPWLLEAPPPSPSGTAVHPSSPQPSPPLGPSSHPTTKLEGLPGHKRILPSGLPRSHPLGYSFLFLTCTFQLGGFTCHIPPPGSLPYFHPTSAP